MPHHKTKEKSRANFKPGQQDVQRPAAQRPGRPVWLRLAGVSGQQFINLVDLVVGDAGETFFKTIKAKLIWRRSWQTRRPAETAPRPGRNAKTGRQDRSSRPVLQPRHPHSGHDVRSIRTRFSSAELAITDNELSAMAAAAIIGLSKPSAAMGMPTEL